MQELEPVADTTEPNRFRTSGKQKVELRDVTLLLPRWEAVHATGGGQRGAELRDDYYRGGYPSRRLLTG